MTRKIEWKSNRKSQKQKKPASDFASDFVCLVLAQEGGNGGRKINIRDSVCVCVERWGVGFGN
jgi:hypothetical protein